MLAADARAGAVVVRTLPADQVLGIGRPSLGQRAPVAVPGPDRRRPAGGVRQHRLPAELRRRPVVGRLPERPDPAQRACARSGAGGHALRCDAAAAYRAMSAAFAAAFGSPICITDSYRTYASQVRLYGQKPALAAVPGHQQPRLGPGRRPLRRHRALRHAAVPWMKANAGRFGFLHPDWAEPGNGREEPWHWEYAGT